MPEEGPISTETQQLDKLLDKFKALTIVDLNKVEIGDINNHVVQSYQ